jgi:thioester reductase-like protein
MSGGGIGIAGVASTSEMQGIKRYKDRSKYKEWEFVFDMSSLQQLQNPQQQQQQQQQQGQLGQNGLVGQPSTPTAPQQPPPGLGGITSPPSTGNGP